MVGKQKLVDVERRSSGTYLDACLERNLNLSKQTFPVFLWLSGRALRQQRKKVVGSISREHILIKNV